MRVSELRHFLRSWILLQQRKFRRKHFLSVMTWTPEFSTQIKIFTHELVMLRNNQINLFNLYDGNTENFALNSTLALKYK
jgi:hypothetical protein